MFENRRSWLPSKVAELEGLGLMVNVKFGSQTGHKPGVVVEVIGHKATGIFEAWHAGEADYTIFMPPSRKADIVASKWGIALTAETFEEIFDNFVNEYRRHEFYAETSNT